MAPKPKTIRRALRRRQVLDQVAALPWRKGRSGVEILLITSRRTRRLIIPKGWPMRRHTRPEAAAIEAMEEAGVEGRITPRPLGHYRYVKVFDDCALPVRVTVFPLRVERQLPDWKEAGERRRVWLPRDAARAAIAERGLSRLFSRL